MSRHPVDDHPDAAAMQMIDEPREILRRAVTVRGREKAGDLITPRTVERMLGRRHDFHVGEAHLDHVIRQLDRQLAVRERAVRVLWHASPRAQMHLVNGHGAVEFTRITTPPLHPRAVAPRDARRVENDRRVIRRPLEVSPVGIGFQAHVAALVAQLKLVQLALA